MGKISVVINTLNEEENLAGAIKSVNNIADQIVVVDMHSDDKTVEIAKELGVKVYEHKREGYVEPARNFAIEKAAGKWILILDADERVPKTLRKKLKNIAGKNDVDYVAIPRRNIVFGKWLRHSRWWPDYNIRFFKKGKVTWDDRIHSIPETTGKGIDLGAKKENALIHHNYKDISQFLRRLDRYSSIQANELIKDGYKFKWRDLLRKPTAEFMSRYFSGFGYRDGVHGLALSLLQAFSELSVVLKVWEKEGFRKEKIEIIKLNQEVRENQKDVNYWLSDVLLREKGGLIYRIKRKFKI